MKGVVRYIVLCCAGLLLSCRPQAPQIPSQRKSAAPEVDSTALALLALNQQLASAADLQLAALVQKESTSYALYEAGTWMCILSRGDENRPHPQEGEEWTIHMRIYNLEGKLLTESEATYPIGKYELPQAVDANIGELYPGGKARLYAPWYSAYGLRGTKTVAPYENVIIEIELK